MERHAISDANAVVSLRQRDISQRTTGNAASAAVSNENNRPSQDKGSPRPALLVPGINNIIKLSTAPIIVIDAMSGCNRGAKCRSRVYSGAHCGNIVSE